MERREFLKQVGTGFVALSAIGTVPALAAFVPKSQYEPDFIGPRGFREVYVTDGQDVGEQIDIQAAGVPGEFVNVTVSGKCTWEKGGYEVNQLTCLKGAELAVCRPATMHGALTLSASPISSANTSFGSITSRSTAICYVSEPETPISKSIRRHRQKLLKRTSGQTNWLFPMMG